MPKRNKINKKDANRVLLTETLPYETPINFSIDYIYSKVTSGSSNAVDRKIVEIVMTLARGSTIPYRYQIRKTENSFRRLALLHPNSQLSLKDLYARYNSLILHYTSKSQISIRAPSKVASTFYSKKSWEDIYKYKDASVSIEDVDDFSKHAPSYFAYRGYDRLWKFYNSDEYINLERAFSHLVTIDVSKCFDSIYTHCMAWATKEKQFTKDNLKCQTFGDEFDKVIRHGNHNETNGIPIGPESSRIFAEIILQQIDCDVIRRVLPRYVHNKHYAARRYVDDILIYADGEIAANFVKVAYTECLLNFNLHVNPLKEQLLTRPFVTKKSTLVSLAIAETEKLINVMFLKHDKGLDVSIIYEPEVILRNYISAIKTICQQVDCGYYDISSLLIAVFVERIKKVCDASRNMGAKISDEDRLKCFKLSLDVCFYLYGVAPTVNSSYKLSTAIILVARYFKDNKYSTCVQLFNYLFHSVQRLLLENNRPKNTLVAEFVDLELINVVLASHELGPSFRLPQKAVKEIFLSGPEKDYFSLSACLFYIGSESQYAGLREEVIGAINEKLDDCRDIKFSSEVAHIFLDAISCPHIPVMQRVKWIRTCLQHNGAASTVADINEFVTQMGDDWTASWLRVDLLNSLEKRELKRAY